MRRRLKRQIEEIIDQRLAERERQAIRNDRLDRVVIHRHPRIKGETIVSFDHQGRRIPRDPTMSSY